MKRILLSAVLVGFSISSLAAFANDKEQVLIERMGKTIQSNLDRMDFDQIPHCLDSLRVTVNVSEGDINTSLNRSIGSLSDDMSIRRVTLDGIRDFMPEIQNTFGQRWRFIIPIHIHRDENKNAACYK